MGNYITIDTIYIMRLNNAEYLSFNNDFLNLIPLDKDDEGGSDRPEIESINLRSVQKGSSALGLSADFLNRYEQEVSLLADVVDESRIAQETEVADLHEKNRDALASYITTRISRAKTLPIEAEREAGKNLYKVAKPYMNIIRLPVAQETEKIKGLLIDLRKPENTSYVTALGLDSYLLELEKENDAYVAATRQRTESRAANQKDSGATIRLRIDELYKEATLLAQSFSIAVPSEAATTFIKNLNQLIKETTTAYNQRGSRKKTTDDKPEIL